MGLRGGVEGWGAAHLQACFSTVHHFQRLEFCLTNAVVATTALAGIGVPQWIPHASLLNARYKLREIWPGVLLFGIVLQECDATISGTVVQIRERCGSAIVGSQSTVAARGMLLLSCSRYTGSVCQRSSQQRCEPQLRRGDERDGGRHGFKDNGMQRKAETVGLCDSSMDTSSPARRRFTGWRAPTIPPAPAPALCTTGEAPVCAGRTAAATCARSPTQRTAHNARRLTVPMLRAGPRW